MAYRILIELGKHDDLKDATILFNQLLKTVTEVTNIVNIERMSLEESDKFQELAVYMQTPSFDREVEKWKEDKHRQGEELKERIRREALGYSTTTEDDDAIN